MSKDKRVYLVIAGGQSRLVEAATTAAARNHVANEFITVRIPTTKEAMDLALDGIGIEQAGKAVEEDPTPDLYTRPDLAPEIPTVEPYNPALEPALEALAADDFEDRSNPASDNPILNGGAL